MKAPQRSLCLVLAGIVLLGTSGSGCGGGVPETGSKAVLPETYQKREKEIMDGFKAGQKKAPATTKK